MKAKTISTRQPWAWLLVNGHKPVENRRSRFKHRGPLLIHASLRMTLADYLACEIFCRGIGFDWDLVPDGNQLERGGIIGQVEVTACVDQLDSDWFTGPFGLVAKDAIALPFYPCKGQLSIFTVDYPFA